ncbi:MAG TPA: hypothetical protein VHL57_10175, partial [Flavobacteriales bacterium]|nr:hypothetical protein [Flavobacteriales bacterium]
MKKIASILLFVLLIASTTRLAMLSYKGAVDAEAMEFPIEGLVVPEHGPMEYERVPLEDIKNLSRGGFPA